MKKILMAAVAVTALTAGAASAANITSAQVNGASVWDGTTAAPYTLANEVVFGTGLSSTSGTILANVSSGKLGVGSYTVTFDLAGPAGFNALLSNTSLASDANSGAGAGSGCVFTPVVQSGGTASSKSVTYAFTLSGTCDLTGTTNSAPRNFTLTSALKVTALGDVTVKATFGQGGSSIDNGASTARTLVTNASAFTASATADAVPTNFALGTSPVYTSLQQGTSNTSINDIIGKVTVVGKSGVYLDMTTGTVASSLNAATLLFDMALSGDFTNLNSAYGAGLTTSAAGVTTGGTGFTRTSPYTSVTASSVAATTDAVIYVSVTGSPTASLTQKSFSLTVTPKQASAPTTYTLPGAFTTTLQSIGLQGVNFTAPWTGGSQSPSLTTLRISNSGAATGAVTLQLLSPTYNTGTTPGATTCSAPTLAGLSSIPANGELVILNSDLTTCFGNFKRGDVVITVQADSTNLTAKARNLNAAGGVVTEMSLR